SATQSKAIVKLQLGFDTDFQFMQLEGHGSGAHCHAILPVLAIRLKPLELQLRDGIEGEDIRRIVSNDAVNVPGAHRVTPMLQQDTNFGLVHGFASGEFHSQFLSKAVGTSACTFNVRTARTSTAPTRTGGIRAAICMASLRSRASIK